MPKSSHFVPKTWFRATPTVLASEFGDAVCKDQSDLPWTGDARPTVDEMNAMGLVCSMCALRTPCARLAMTGGNFGKPVEGGFYAGYWLPWPSSGESGDVRLMRRVNRSALRRLAGL